MLRLALIPLFFATFGAAATETTFHSGPRIDPRYCSIPAYAAPHRKPVKVYSGPTRSADAVGYLPVSTDEDGRRKGAYVTIISMQRDWAHVADAVSWDNGKKGPDGWVKANQLRFALQTSHGFASPNPESTLLVTTDWLLPDKIGKLEDCYRDWVHVTVKSGGKARKAWFRGACANQETTCDGVLGDPVSEREQPPVPAER